MAAGSHAIVVPAYRDSLSDDEELALQHLDHYLPSADKYLVMPDGLSLRRHDYREARFPSAYFRSIAGYNALMLGTAFYSRFAAYEYVLIHQLDAIVFRSDVEPFLALGVDYLGAPWVAHDAIGAPRLTHVGNGGLSLRRVDGFLRLLTTASAPREHVREYYRRRYSHGSLKYRLAGIPKTGLAALGFRSARQTIARLLGRQAGVDLAADARAYSQGGEAEDMFLSLEARNYCPDFTFGTIAQALDFAFETEPRFCFELAGGRLPFGAHAWSRYDRAFWEPFLLP